MSAPNPCLRCGSTNALNPYCSRHSIGASWRTVRMNALRQAEGRAEGWRRVCARQIPNDHLRELARLSHERAVKALDRIRTYVNAKERTR